MAPKQDKQLLNKYPTFYRELITTGDKWLDSKRCDDGLEGLWRVHDHLYDFTDFIKAHPGGSMWLELTKGTDITEAFECHHLTTLPEKTLKKYLIRPANGPRNSPFTFEEDGFFRTLKRNVRPILKTIPKDVSRRSHNITDGCLIGMYIFAILACAFWSFICAIVSGVLLFGCTAATHNYFHQKDNFRMYYFNVSMLQFREWRIIHSLSHHIFTNTLLDLQITFIEPIVQYLPKKKSLIVKYFSWIYIFPLWFNLFLISFIKRILQYVIDNETRQLEWSNILPFSLPLVMYCFGGQSLFATCGMWLIILEVGSFLFSMFAFIAAHNHPEIFHEGDAPRNWNGIDWGIHQLDTVSDRHGIAGNLLLVLVTFGDHGLHHMFPSLDHSVLNYLYPVFEETMKQFNVELRMKSPFDMMKGQFMQMAREETNKNPPGLRNLSKIVAECN